MIIKGALKDHSPYNKFLVLVGLILVFGGLFTVIGSMLAKWMYGVDVITVINLVPGVSGPEQIASFKLLQTLMSVGTFVIPPIVAAFLFSERSSIYLNTN